MNETLKPCPFCGHDEAGIHKDNNKEWFVLCWYCDAQSGHYNDGYTPGESGKAKAIAAWNRRCKKPAKEWVD